ncbi:hypothetical protein L2E82_20637 [Cichorium intybus]|uniref:Uncharacterized protein n=1 Tax=Cichorium intybus TaxID=13427 RepID=A0ACB9DU76_CICIN|nr:hypothetical protein L2E82_20637 [Cichorium intybus]
MGSKKLQACNQLLQSVTRYTKMLDEVELVQLEVELTAALLRTQSRKRELMMKNVWNLDHEQENKSTDENEQLMQQVASADNQIDNVDDDDDDGGGVHNHNQTDPSQLRTLSLFKD